MVGSTDVTLKAVGDPETVEAFARLIQHVWPTAQYEDAGTGAKYDDLGDIPFGQAKELLVYPDWSTMQLWDEGREAPENSLTALVCRDQDVTLVCDAPQRGTIQTILEGARGLTRSLRGSWV